MSILHEISSRFLSLFRSDPGDRLDEELKAHAELLAADYIARGLTTEDAKYAAARDLGNATAMRQMYREQNSLPMLENFWLDFKFAIRSLRRNPTFAFACISTLTVGLGAMIAILCVVSALVWKPLPYPNPASLVVVKEVDPRNGFWTFSEPSLLDLQERTQSLTHVGAFRRDSVALTGSGEPEAIQAVAVTPSVFNLLGIVPITGRTITDSHSQVFISRELWNRKWRMNPEVIGHTIILGGDTYTIAGVGDMPVDLLPGVELLYPLAPKASESRTAHDVEAVARLRKGTAMGQAQAELSTLSAQIAREHLQTNAGWSMRAMPLADYIAGPNTNRTVWMIFAAVALLWILACANVAGLQIARSVTRRHEMSTRVALGASRTRLMSQTLTESFVLAVVGGMLGTVLAEYLLAATRTFGGGLIPRLAHVQLDPTDIFIPAACMIASTALFGLLPGRIPSFEAREEIAKRDSGRDALIVMQVALASVLLLGATLLFQSFTQLQAVNPGFNPENILTVRVSLPDRSLDTAHKIAFFANAAEQLSHVPGIQSVGATNGVPFSGEGTANRFRIEGDTSSGFQSAAWRSVSPGFFTTLALPLKRGRFFTDADRGGAPEVVILSESMAQRYWPNQDPIGKHLLWGKSASIKTVVGVVGDLRDLAVDVPPAPTMFRPFAQLSDPPMTMLVRTKTDPTGAIADIRRQIWNVDRNAALECQTLTEAMSASIVRPTATFITVGAFAVIALITAAFGLYGLIVYRVNQRRQEIGIRVALGANASSVQWSVQKRCLNLVLTGAAIGLPLAFALSHFVSSLLYKTELQSPEAYAAVLVAFIATGFLASLGPALRASRIDPASAIRHE